MGIGPIGLMAVEGARHLGAARIIAVGSRPVCVKLAREFGATEVISYRERGMWCSRSLRGPAAWEPTR